MYSLASVWILGRTSAGLRWQREPPPCSDFTLLNNSWLESRPDSNFNLMMTTRERETARTNKKKRPRVRRLRVMNIRNLLQNRFPLQKSHPLDIGARHMNRTKLKYIYFSLFSLGSFVRSHIFSLSFGRYFGFLFASQCTEQLSLNTYPPQ